MKQTKKAALPLFPLSNLVMPGGQLPLRLFEPRYLDMIKKCFKTDTGFGVCLIENGAEVGADVTPYPRGTRVSITDFDQGDDGLLHITALGVEEFWLHEYQVQPDGLLVGQVSFIDSTPVIPLPASYRPLASKLEKILHYVEPHIRYAEAHIDECDWVSNRLLELLPLEAKTKYKILSLPNVLDRLVALNDLQLSLTPE